MELYDPAEISSVFLCRGWSPTDVAAAKSSLAFWECPSPMSFTTHNKAQQEESQGGEGFHAYSLTMETLHL
jgi:hypothetical protein